MKIFFASKTILKILILFIHLGKAYCTIRIILQINFFSLFFIAIHATPQPLGQLFIQNIIGSLRYSCWWRFKIIKNLIILCNLGNNKEDMFTRFFFHAEVNTAAIHISWNTNMVLRTWSLTNRINTPSTLNFQKYYPSRSADNKNIFCFLLRYIRSWAATVFFRYFLGLAIGWVFSTLSSGYFFGWG